MKKILTIFCFMIIIIGLTSCNKYEDLVPNSSDYANWDGNYIYKGNYRSKTTGEDEERLIKNIEYNGNTYYINDYNYSIYDNNLYYFFTTKSNKELKECDSSFLIKYIIKDKKYEILYASTTSVLNFKIEKVYENYIYCIDLDSSLDYCIYRCETKDLIYLNDVTSIRFFDNDVFLEIDNTLKHSNSSEINFKTIISLKYRDPLISDDENSDYIKIVYDNKGSDVSRYKSLGYFNKKTGEYKELISAKDQKEFYYINEEYFILYESKTFEYVMNVKERNTKTIETNCNLCKVNLDSFSYEVIYTFKDADASFTDGVLIGNTYFMKRVKVKQGWFIFYGGSRTKTYKLDLDTLKLSRDYDKVVNQESSIVKGVTYNNKFYYLENKTFGAFLNKKDVFYLYSKSLNNNQEHLMQFFVYDYDTVQDNYLGTRSSIDMWYNSIDFNDLNTLILDY